MCFTGPGFAQKTHVEEVETGEKFELLVFAKVSHHLTYRFLPVHNKGTVKFILARFQQDPKPSENLPPKKQSLYIKTLENRRGYLLT